MYEVKQSAIHGKGLFASEVIHQGQELGRCESKLTDEQDIYTLTLDTGEMHEITCDLKYINHSKSPNVVYYSDLSVVALCDIKPGEELLHDYGEEWQ